MRVLPLLPLACVLLLAACSKPQAVPDPVRAVRTVTVATERTLPASEYAGEVRARTESLLSFRVSGKMTRRLANLGDVVRSGQALAELDPRDLRLGQDAARAGVALAQANFDQDAADFKRYKELSDKGFIGPAELDRRDMALKSARAQLDQAQAQAQVQGHQVDYATLNADAPGVVTAVMLEPGMVAAAGTPVLRLAHDGPRDVVFEVPEDRVDQVKAAAAQPGSVQVRLWGDGVTALPARVREIAAAADPVTRTFQVKADLGDVGAHSVRLGQTATVRMAQPALEQVTKLPLSALREDHGRSAVWIVDPVRMTVDSQSVTVAGADGNEAVIAAGLVPGQLVVTAGVHVLSPGQRVKFYAEPAAAPASAGATAASAPR
jgi:RND family efflux transporter MFP subunit